MTNVNDEFIQQLPLVLRLFCNPTTPHTSQELWCRIDEADGDRLVPILLTHLKSTDSNIVRLVLDILQFEAGVSGRNMLKEHVDVFVNFLQDENLCVRQSAINLLGALNVSSNKVIDALRQTMATNEIYLASEAAFTMLKLKPDEAENLMPFLTQTLDSDDPKPKHLVIENVDLLGRHAEQLLPRIGELLDDSCLGFGAALAILTITGDDSCARQLVEKWRSGEVESEFDCTEPFYPDLLLQVADELEESIRRIQSKRHS